MGETPLPPILPVTRLDAPAGLAQPSCKQVPEASRPTRPLLAAASAEFDKGGRTRMDKGRMPPRLLVRSYLLAYDANLSTTPSTWHRGAPPSGFCPRSRRLVANNKRRAYPQAAGVTWGGV